MAKSSTKSSMPSQNLFLKLEKMADKDFQKQRFAFSKTTPNFLKPTIASSAKRVSIKSVDSSMKIPNKSTVNNTKGSPKKTMDNEKRRSNIQPWKPIPTEPRPKPQEHRNETNINKPKFISTVPSRPAVKSEQKKVSFRQTIASRLRTKASWDARKTVKAPIEIKNTYTPTKTISAPVTTTEAVNNDNDSKNDSKFLDEFVDVFVNEHLEELESTKHKNHLEDFSDNELTSAITNKKNCLNLGKEIVGDDKGSLILLKNEFYKVLGLDESKPTVELHSSVLPDCATNNEGQSKDEKTQAVLKWLEASPVEQMNTISTECEDIDTDSSIIILPNASAKELSTTLKSNMMQRVSDFISPPANHTTLKSNVTKCGKISIPSSSSFESSFPTGAIQEEVTKETNTIETVFLPPVAQEVKAKIRTECKLKESNKQTLYTFNEPEGIEVNKNNFVLEDKKLLKPTLSSKTVRPTQSLANHTNLQMKTQRSPKNVTFKPFFFKNSSQPDTRKFQLKKSLSLMEPKVSTKSPKSVHAQNKTVSERHADSPIAAKMRGAKQNLSFTQGTSESEDLNTRHIPHMKMKKCKTVAKKSKQSLRNEAVSRRENLKVSGMKKAVTVRMKYKRKPQGVKKAKSSSQEKIKVKKTSKPRKRKKSTQVVLSEQEISGSETSSSESESTRPNQSTKHPKIHKKTKKKGRKKKGKNGKRKFKRLLPNSCQKNEKVELFKDQFFFFAKFGDRRNSGITISMSNSIRWLKQAGIIDGRRVTKNDAEIFFVYTTQRRRSLTIQEFIHFLNVLASQKGLHVAKMIESLISCGNPNASMTDVTIERMLQLNPDNVENPFAEPIFINDTKRRIPIIYKSSESYLESQKTKMPILQKFRGEPEGAYTIPVRFKSSEGFIPMLDNCAATSSPFFPGIATLQRKQLESSKRKDPQPRGKAMKTTRPPRTRKRTKNSLSIQNSQLKSKNLINSTKPESKVMLKLKTNTHENSSKSDMSSSGSGLSPRHSISTNQSLKTIARNNPQKNIVTTEKSHPKNPSGLNHVKEQQELASAGQDILKFFTKKEKLKMPAKVIRIRKRKRPKQNQNVETLIGGICPSSPNSEAA